MFIETRLIGRKSRPLDGWVAPVPPDADGGEDGLTLRQLITRVVRAEIRAFERRQQARRLIRVLSASEISSGAARGKVDPGANATMTEPVDVEAALGASIQGFIDGLYLVILDGVELRELEQQVFPKDDSKLVFLRLTFLAGA